MKRIPAQCLTPLLGVSLALLPCGAVAQYNQATTGVIAGGTNLVEKSATAAPNDFATCSNAVSQAHAAGQGGVFDLPGAVVNGTTSFRGTYGLDQGKRLTLTAEFSMQNLASGGTLSVMSLPNATTSQTDRSSYNLAIGPITDVLTDAVLLSEQVSQIGLVMLARTHATYPLDIQLTAYYSDGTTQSAIANVGNPKNTDDTFFGFTAPAGEAITNLLFEGFATGTTTPVGTRLGFDDFSFVTTPTGVLPPPQIVEVYPANGAVHWASNGMSFVARSEVAIEPAGLTLVLNGVDVSAQLVISGEPTNRLASYAELAPDVKYKAEMTVSNVAGSVTVTQFLYTPETTPVVVFDAGGFTNETVYPPGLLTSVTNNDNVWLPAPEPAEIVDLADGTYDRVMRRMQMGNDQIEYLLHTPVASGVLIVEVDARVSSIEGRVLDLALSPAVGGIQGPFLMWGTNALNYYNGTAWVAVAPMDTEWHRIKFSSYVSGPKTGTFDLSVDGTSVASGLVWRTVFSPVYRFRVGAIRGDLTQYGEVDNVVMSVMPEPLAAVPVVLTNPTYSGGDFSFTFESRAGITHVAEYNADLMSTVWTTLETVIGDGSPKVVTHTNAPADPLFYRVRSFVP